MKSAMPYRPERLDAFWELACKENGITPVRPWKGLLWPRSKKAKTRKRMELRLPGRPAIVGAWQADAFAYAQESLWLRKGLAALDEASRRQFETPLAAAA